MCDACLWSSSRMQVVAGPMGVSRGTARCEGRPPRQHHHANMDNISGLPPYTPPPPTSTPQDMHPRAMHVYSHHLVCRWWPAQRVFVGGWLFMRDVCHVSTTTPIQMISVEGSAAFCLTHHLPQCQSHRTHIRLQCMSMVIIWYVGGVRPNGCLWEVGVFECRGYCTITTKSSGQLVRDLFRSTLRHFNI